ncbi:GH1 family beta-glucosidase [candidate division KSB1 bacterium]|nr:GH1 family beta-glucosidase [candidate division KSB1 bacterium]
MNPNLLIFPNHFLWGAATAAYQIEGAYAEAGKGASIWDHFTSLPGKIKQGHTGQIACDHYHRTESDVQLMANLGLPAYRFSISWPRLFPTGKAPLNTPGLAFYDRLVDTLLAHHMTPMITLYHWDLPQALQEKGGWVNRDTIYYFRDYAATVAQKLGDRVYLWITHNEPAVTAFQGHYQGILAPGMRDLKIALQVVHHLLVSHGLAVAALRENIGAKGKIGIALNLTPVYPLTESKSDREAAENCFLSYSGWFLDALFHARYPEKIVACYQPQNLMPQIQPGDWDLIAGPLDFLGLNYYTREVVRQAIGANVWGFQHVKPPAAEFTAMGWEIFPRGLFDILKTVHETYYPGKIFITENGAAFDDQVTPTGQIHDSNRIQYLHQHFNEAWRAIQAGIPLAGYFLWSLMDNFEWAEGFTKRFGMVYVDYPTQARIPKDSAHWYSEVMRQNGVSAID